MFYMLTNVPALAHIWKKKNILCQLCQIIPVHSEVRAPEPLEIQVAAIEPQFIEVSSLHVHRMLLKPN